jgi:diguanylate cyclase (GGDEF)-like protein/PAS domain S-box-containing protein
MQPWGEGPVSDAGQIPMSEAPKQFDLHSADLEQAFHEMVLDSLYDGVYFVDSSRTILYWNKGAEKLTGYSAEDVVGHCCSDNILMHTDDCGRLLCLEGCPLSLTMLGGQRQEKEVYLRHKLGHRVAVSVRSAPITNRRGEIIGAVEVFTDITAKKRIERRVGELEGLVYLDALTGVPNRRYMELRVEQAVQEVAQFDRSIGLLMIDLDDFKQVNDQHGHDAGDIALKTLSKLLTQSLRSSNVMGRWGGEEFLVIVSGTTPEGLRAYAERCRKDIAWTKIPLPSGAVQLTASIGATMIEHHDSRYAVVKRADELMYRSKIEGRDRATFG